jgi:hypothetical protein
MMLWLFNVNFKIEKLKLCDLFDALFLRAGWGLSLQHIWFTWRFEIVVDFRYSRFFNYFVLSVKLVELLYSTTLCFVLVEWIYLVIRGQKANEKKRGGVQPIRFKIKPSHPPYKNSNKKQAIVIQTFLRHSSNFSNQIAKKEL